MTTLLAVVLGLPAENLPRSSDSFDPETDDDIPADVYINHEEMTAWMQAMALRYPELASLKSVGKSVQGRDLWAMELSRSVERGQRDLLMPMMKLVGNIHGNEVVGRHVLLRMISYLITKEGSDERIAQLLNTTDIFIMPTMNPDGFSRAQVTLHYFSLASSAQFSYLQLHEWYMSARIHFTDRNMLYVWYKIRFSHWTIP